MNDLLPALIFKSISLMPTFPYFFNIKYKLKLHSSAVMPKPINKKRWKTRRIFNYTFMAGQSATGGALSRQFPLWRICICFLRTAYIYYIHMNMRQLHRYKVNGMRLLSPTPLDSNWFLCLKKRNANIFYIKRSSGEDSVFEFWLARHFNYAHKCRRRVERDVWACGCVLAKGQWRTLLKGSLPRPKWAGQ